MRHVRSNGRAPICTRPDAYEPGARFSRDFSWHVSQSLRVWIGRLSVIFAVHLEDFKVHLGSAANKESLFYDGEPVLFIEATRICGGHHDECPFVPCLGALDGQREQATAQARTSGLWVNEKKCDLAWNEPKEAKDSTLPFSNEDLAGLDGGMVNFVRSLFEPSLELGWGVRVRTKMPDRILVCFEDRL